MSVELREALDEVAGRLRSVRMLGALAVCWLGWGLVGLLLAILAPHGIGRFNGWSLLGTFAGLTTASGLVCAWLTLRSARDPRGVARRIEARHPELATGLLATLETDDERLGFLEDALLREVIAHRQAHDWDETVPTRALRATEVAHAATLGALIAAAVLLAVRAGPIGAAPAGAADLGRAARGLVVEPGDTEIERGASLLVVGHFRDDVPAEATLVIEGPDSAESRRPMTRSLDDPTFAGRVANVERDLSYRIEFAGRSSETYRVTVFEFPEVLRADADLRFPSYTGLTPKTVEDVRHVTAVEGTELTLRLRLNKQVATARLVDGDGEVVDLAPRADRGGTYEANFTLSAPRRYRVDLVDAEGRANPFPTELAINVTRNRPAEVRATRPGRDSRVSSIEELALAAEHTDDYGVVRHGLSFTMAGRDPSEIVLGESADDAPKNVVAAHMIAFETLGVEPDQLASYHFWAEDIGPDGEVRRSLGDMFFAEIHPFEEVFRQGEPPPGGASASQGPQGGGNAQQAMELAELQKQIINGTWTLIRRGAGAESFDADAGLLRDSQVAAIEQANRLAGELDDPGSIEQMTRAIGFMEEASGLLKSTADAHDPEPLDRAIVAEQSAYQALLKLRDREFQVVQGSPGQQGGGASAGGPSQRQLQQLELSNDENRYEQQRSAAQESADQADQAQRELRQVLNRLRELARRQNDLNDRIKELQSALEAAEDEQDRDEIDRQLKRLREQQEQLLRDTDELQERMEREENRDRMAEAREQVEAGREHVRQASEALEQGRLSQALTEGTRAGRQLDELGEELRKETSDRFGADLNEMKDRAQRLAEDQGELSKQLDALNHQSQRSLRGDGDRDQVREGLEDQQEELDRLLEQMRRTVQEAEQTEPLLAEELFDAVKEADRRSVADALEAAEQLAGLGVAEEAARASRHASEGLEELRDGVERAAEHVLGDATAALRLARSELDDLAEQVDREFVDPENQENEGGPSGSSSETREDEDADGRNAPPTDQPGAGQNGSSDQVSAQENEPSSREHTGEQGHGQGQGQGGEPPSQSDDPQSGGNPQGGAPSGQGGQPGEQGSPGQRSLRDEPGNSQGGGAGGGASGLEQLLQGMNTAGNRGPITGDGFREWSDRMRDVEELLDDPEMRAEAARIRDRVRGAREDYRRHSVEPEPEALRELVAEPIRELRDLVAEEVRRRESPDALVPIDRDPVPPRFAEGVRRYYERIGSGR